VAYDNAGLLATSASRTANVDNVAGPTYVSGSIAHTLAWTAANSPYVVTGNVVIPADKTVTIEPGAQVRFDGLYNLQVGGDLQAVGTPDQMIVFTSNQASPGAGRLGPHRVHRPGGGQPFGVRPRRVRRLQRLPHRRGVRPGRRADHLQQRHRQQHQRPLPEERRRHRHRQLHRLQQRGIPPTGAGAESTSTTPAPRSGTTASPATPSAWCWTTPTTT